MNNPQFQLNNPAYQIIAVEPREGVPGQIIFKTELPNIPPIILLIAFDRNRAEEFSDKFRQALDVAKGLKKA